MIIILNPPSFSIHSYICPVNVMQINREEEEVVVVEEEEALHMTSHQCQVQMKPVAFGAFLPGRLNPSSRKIPNPFHLIILPIPPDHFKRWTYTTLNPAYFICPLVSITLFPSLCGIKSYNFSRLKETKRWTILLCAREWIHSHLP